MIQAPPKTIKSLLGMDAQTDPTMLPDGKMILIQNMVPDKTGWETRLGITKFDSTEVVAANPIQGVGRYYTAPGTGYELAVADGHLKKSSGAGWSDLYGSLHTTNLSQIFQFKKVALINDQYSGLLVYQDGQVPYLAGIPSAQAYKTIEGFELASAWTTVNGTAYDDPGHALQGNQSVRFTSTGAVTMTATKSITAVNLTGSAIYPDGSSSSVYDSIAIFCIRGNPTQISSCVIRLSTTADTAYFETDLALCYDWENSLTNYAGMHLRVRKSAFTKVGSALWSSINQIKITVVTASALSITFDWLRLEKSSPLAHDYSKIICAFDNTEGWALDAGALPGLNTQYKSIGNSFAFSGANKIHLLGTDPSNPNHAAGVWDLTKFDDGTSTATIDDISIFLGKLSNTAGTLKLTFSNGSKTAYYTFTPVTMKAVKQYFQTKVTGWSVGGGFNLSSDWNAIDTITIESTGSGTIFVDQLQLVRHVGNLPVAMFDSTVGWALDAGSGAGNSISYYTTTGFYRPDENSVGSLCLTNSRGNSAELKLTVSLDLSLFSTGVAVQTSDKLGLWVKIPVYTYVGSIEMQLGAPGDSTNYFTRTISTDEFPELAETPSQFSRNAWFDLHFPISSWDVKGSPSWASITELRIYTVQAKVGVGYRCYFDSWTLSRKDVLSGTFQYMMTFITPNGEEGEPSIASEPVTISGSTLYLTNLPQFDATYTTRIVSRNVYRIGGTSSTWQFVDTISDPNLTTTYIDTTLTEALGAPYLEIYGQPYKPTCMTLHDKSIVIANLTTPDGINYPAGYMVSEEDSYETFQHKLYFEIEPDLGKRAMWVHSQFSRCFTGKEDSIWSFDPNNLSQNPNCESRLYGGVSLLSVCAGVNEFYFLDKIGVISYNGSFFDEHIGDGAKPYIEAIVPADLKLCWMQYWEDYLLVGIPYAYTGQTPYVDTILVCYRPQDLRKWFIITGWKVGCAFTYKTVEGTILHLGGSNSGYVFHAFNGDTDLGVDITSILHFPDSDWGVPELGKDYAKLFIYGLKSTSTDVPLTIAPWIDQADSGVTLVEDINGNATTLSSTTLTRLEINGVQFGYHPMYLGLMITAGKRWRFRGLTQIVSLQEPTF